MLRLFVLLALLGCRRAPAPPEPPSAPPPDGPSAAAMSWYLQAVVAEERGDTLHADRAWAWVVREDRQNAQAHAHRARFLVRQRRWPEAEVVWRKAVALDPAWWEPYAGLAALAGRRGERDEELRLLDEAVARSADVATLERTLERHEAVGDREGARATLAVWLAREGLSDDERRRRWFAAQRLDMADRALRDLRSTVDPRLPASALMFVDEALSACDLAEALDWAQEIGRAPEAPAHPLVGVALEVALQAGDLATIERLLGLSVEVEIEIDVPAGDLGHLERRLGLPVERRAPPAGDRPSDWGSSPLALAEAPAVIRAADGWFAVGHPERGRALLDAVVDDPALSGWVHVVAALRDPASPQAARDPADVRPDGAAQIAWALRFFQGQADAIPAAAALRQLGAPERIASVLGALAPRDADARVQAGTGQAITAGPGPGGGVLLLPPTAAPAWRDEVDARLAADGALSLSAAAAWVARSPGDPRAQLAMSRVDPERARIHVDRALAMDPCAPDALAARARLADEADRAAWEERVRRADPLRPR